ncbi:MAG: cellulose synthase subunit BcsC-related outer membrane protein [Stagnimonas sp.]|nr:cellulose synthase subunit BcsC-related outer membrane protein [Stagnimonas sp.]
MLRLALISVVLALGLPFASQAETASGSDQLATQARYWEGKGRYDLARENWLKLLRASPDNPTALSGLVNAEAISGRAAAAQVYLDRLKEAHPEHPDLRRLEAQIRQGSYDQDKLGPARTLARQGKYQQAVEAYRALFNNEIPGGRLGLEYYQTLAGTDDGWQPARAGIEKLAQDNFDEPIYQLALAQHLTYRESTRRQGIARLAELGREAAVATPARQAWRQGLLWLDAKTGDESLYQTYLKQVGEDPQLAAKLAALRSGGAVAGVSVGGRIASLPPEPTAEELRGRLVKTAFDALNDGKLELAEAQFLQAMREYGESADALGGLGIVRLRQEAYPEAADLLQRASSRDKKRAGRWKDALDTARFWEAVRGAEAARKAGNSAQSERLLRRALAMDAKRSAAEPSVASSLADVLVEQEQLAEAEKIYREVLRRHPDNSDALRGLIGLLARDKRLAEAIAVAERAPVEVRAQLGSFGVLKAQYLRDQAAEALRLKDEVRAEGLLREALLVDPESPWTRLDLARIYQGQKRVREANTLIDGLLAPGSGPVQGEALFIKALLLAEQQNWYEGLQLLEQIEPGARTTGMADLQKRLWVRYQTQRAGVYSRLGQPGEAARILAEVEPHVGETPELLGALASAYADVGDENRALRYIRQALSRTAGASQPLRLQYASLLFKLRQDAEFEVVMEDLLRQGGLDPQQSVDLANLRIAYRLRQADLVREEGDLARAYEYLQPLLRVNPNDPRLMMALARLYNDSRDYEKAYGIYQKVLAQNDKEIDAYKGAVNAALSLARWDEADALLERAFVIEPNNPRLYALAGRSARGRGDDGRALQLFQQALRLDAELGGEAGGNPFSNSQPLLQLIDPSAAGGYPAYPSGIRAEAAPPRPPPIQLASADGFFEVRADRALRPAAKKKVATPAPLPARRIAVRGKQESRPARLSRLAWNRGDVALPAPRGRGRLWKVSTPPGSGSSSPASGSLDRPSGYWTEEPQAGGGKSSYRYVEGTPPSTVPTAPDTVYRSGSSYSAPYGAGSRSPVPVAPATAGEFPAPRRPGPGMSPSLSKPRPSLRDEVMGNIADINRDGQGSATGGTPAPQIYYGDGYGVYEVPRIDGPYQAPQPVYREAVPGYPSPVYRAPVQTVPPPPASTVRRGPVLDPRLSNPEYLLSQQNESKEDRQQILKEIGDLRARRSPYAQLGMGLRSRDGSPGLDRLYDIEAPVEVGFPATEAGRFKIRAVPVYLDAGTLSGRNVPLFGTLGLATALTSANGDDPADITGRRFSQSASGVAVGLGYEVGEFKADIGTSPLGFPVETLVGGINWRPSMGRTSFKIDVARRSVTDSLLSYAGVRDPGTGLIWGGVTKTGGRLDVAFDLGRYGVYGNGSYHVLDGEYLPQNSVVEIGGGLYARAIETRNNRVTYGLNLTAFGYEKNLRRFSFGHGGYFSPQSYFAVSVPVEWEGHQNRFSYKVSGAFGLQSFSEDGAGFYPSDVGLADAYADALELADPELQLSGGYPSKQSTGVGFSFAGQFEYMLDTNLVAGARLSLDNARDYQEGSALGYLRYNFYPQVRVNNPPALLLPYFNYGDPRL